MLVHWFTEMQTNIAKSSIQSEFNGLLSIGMAIVWIRNFLIELGWCDPEKVGTILTNYQSREKFDQTTKNRLLVEPSTVFCDCEGAVKLAVNGKYGKRTKHIEVSAHSIHEWQNSGDIEVVHIPRELQPADCRLPHRR